MNCLFLFLGTIHAFVPNSKPGFYSYTQLYQNRERSRVVDFDGPTPEVQDESSDTIDLEDIPEYHYDENVHPIPHQPWRRGETLGCEDPIDSPWRKEAEAIITVGASQVGAQVVGVTWYLTTVVITISPDLSSVPEYQSGPEVVFETTGPPVYKNPDNPSPEDIIPDEEDEFLWERDVVGQEERERNVLVHREEGEDEDDTIDKEIEMKRERENLPLDKETREDIAGFSEEQISYYDNYPTQVVSNLNYFVDQNQISTVAKAILDALELKEEELNVLGRHEVLLTTPRNDPNLLDRQDQFDANIGADVVVETQDPWESNRVLRGALLERNSMDLIINKKGNMVTIPLCFVKNVHLEGASMIEESPEEWAEKFDDLNTDSDTSEA